MEVKKGMRLVAKVDGIKATIMDIEGIIVNILDDDDLIPWTLHIKAVPAYFWEIKGGERYGT